MKIIQTVTEEGGSRRMGLGVTYCAGLGGQWLWVLLAFLMAHGGLGHGRSYAAEVNAAKEHELKAVFIFNFVKFAEWPPERLPPNGSALVIGVVGKGPIHAALEAAVKDRRLHGRELVVRPVENVSSARDVHLLFVTGSEDGQLEQWLPALSGNGTLTVGETEAFLGHGGMICLKILDDKLRFEINMDAVERDRIKLSAQLQKLATAVRRKS